MAVWLLQNSENVEQDLLFFATKSDRVTASFQFLLPVNDIELLCKFSASNKAAKCQTPKILLMMANVGSFLVWSVMPHQIYAH